LQIGCGDGYFAGLLLSQGYQVTACDNSPELLQKTENSNKAAVNKGRLTTALVDVNNSFSFDDRFDHTIAVMRSFFRYCRRPNAALRELRDLTRGKLIIDVDPRKYDLQRAWQQIADAGFSPLERRAFLTPQKRRLPRLLQKSMWLFERTPIVYRPLLKRKFHVWILAENETLRDE
jgi:SAM-dependent methyltransferase